MVGLFYTLPYALSGLYTSNLTKAGNRKWALFGIISFLSCLKLGAGLVPSFGALVAFRFMHGLMASSVDPMAYSLISDIFPPDKRTTANSILSAGNFLGIALSSMTLILIKNVGWRASYMTMGGMGLLFGTLLLLGVKNPPKGAFDVKK